MTEAIRMNYWRGAKGLVAENFVRLKELSTCDKCGLSVNVYVMIWPLQMQVCERCYSRINKWGRMRVKHLLGYVAGDGV